MSELKLPRLLAAAKEFNIGQDTLIEFLVKKGFNRNDLKPTAKLNENHYHALQNEFQNDKVTKRKADNDEILKNNLIEKIDVTYFLDNNNIPKYDDIYPFPGSINQILNIINKNLESKNPVLDLGRCSLTDDLLEAESQIDALLRECVHLKTIIFSNIIMDGDTRIKSQNKFKPNYLTKVPNCLSYLNQLNKVYCSGDAETPWLITSMDFINQLPFLEVLDLSYNSISRFPDEGIIISSLKSLNLRRNEFTNLECPETFATLTSLDLSNNILTEITSLVQLKDIEKLNLANNKLFESINFNSFQNIKEINLSGNQLDKFYFPSDCPQLKSIDLSRNVLTIITGFENLLTIESLSFDSNNLSRLNTIEKIKGLKFLKLQFCNLESLASFNSLDELETLDIRNNIISDFSGLENCKDSLRTIWASTNKILNLEGLQEFNALNELDVRNNKIQSITPLLKIEHLKTVYLDSNPVIEKIPNEVRKVGWQAIKDRIIKGNLTIFEDVKILLLGNTNVGKSNLLEYLITSKQPSGLLSTHGISYQKLVNKIKKRTLHVWDFGGQEFFHATHQLFFSPGGLHIIIWSRDNIQRDTNNPEACFDLNYWIRCVERLIPNDDINKIEVIIVENKIDLNDFMLTPIDQPALCSKFKNLNFSFTGISLRPLKRIPSFIEQLSERIDKLVTEHPKAYISFYNKIKNCNEGFLSIKKFSEEERETAKTAMKVFHNMGILLYFPTILPDKIFVKPQLLLNLLYKDILDHKKMASISKSEIENSILGNKLGLVTSEVISLLKKFDLVFEIPEKEDVFFVPQYLPESPTFIKFFHKHQFGKPNIVIESDSFLMNVAMLKLFGNYGQYVEGQGGRGNEKLFWKDGIVIQKDNMLLMITFDRQNQRLLLFPDILNSNFLLQKEIVDFILQIPELQNPLPNADKQTQETASSEEEGLDWSSTYFMVKISLDGEYFVSWEKLFQQRLKGLFQIELSSIFNITETVQTKTISVFDFNLYLPSNSKGEMKNIFISYSKSDFNLVTKFLEHLSALKLDGKIKTWFCTELKAGGEWNDEIQKHFDEADIVCFMISPNFMNTDYIHEHEIKKAFDKKKIKKRFLILPIILDFCRWTTVHNDLSQFTALPYTAKPVMDFRNQNMAWYIIQECIRLIIDLDQQPEGDELYNNAKLPKDVLNIYKRIVAGKVDDNSDI